MGHLHVLVTSRYEEVGTKTCLKLLRGLALHMCLSELHIYIYIYIYTDCIYDRLVTRVSCCGVLQFFCGEVQFECEKLFGEARFDTIFYNHT